MVQYIDAGKLDYTTYIISTFHMGTELNNRVEKRITLGMGGLNMYARKYPYFRHTCSLNIHVY